MPSGIDDHLGEADQCVAITRDGLSGLARRAPLTEVVHAERRGCSEVVLSAGRCCCGAELEVDERRTYLMR